MPDIFATPDVEAVEPAMQRRATSNGEFKVRPLADVQSITRPNGAIAETTAAEEQTVSVPLADMPTRPLSASITRAAAEPVPTIDLFGKKVDAYIRSIPPIKVGSERDDILQAATEQRKVDQVPGTVSSTDRILERSYDRLFMLDPNAGRLFPGNIVQGRAFAHGELSSVPLKITGGTLSLSNLSFDSAGAVYSQKVDEFTNAAVEQARTQLLRQGKAYTTAKAQSEFFRAYSLQQMAVALGVSYSSLTATADLAAKFESIEEDSVVVVRFAQEYYSLSVPGKPTPHEFFRKVAVDELRPYVGPPDNPPIYISSVKYGRLLIFVIRSRYSYQNVKLACQASFDAFAASGKFTLNDEQTQILNSSDANLIVVGGNALTLKRAFAAGSDGIAGLQEILSDGLEFSASSPGAPIAYTGAYLSNNTVAKVSLVGTYTQESFSAYRWTRFALEGTTTGDDKEPDNPLTVRLEKDGRLLARGTDDTRLYENKPFRIEMNRDLGDARGRDVANAKLIIRTTKASDDWDFRDITLYGWLETGDQYRLLNVPTNMRLSGSSVEFTVPTPF